MCGCVGVVCVWFGYLLVDSNAGPCLVACASAQTVAAVDDLNDHSA